MREGGTQGMILLLILLGALGCVSDASHSLGKDIAGVAPCPDSPNCIPSLSEDPRHAMPPLPYLTSGRESMDRLVQIVQGMNRATIVSAAPTYLHVEFRSAVFPLVDDVAFVLDDAARVIHFRSASRTGWYDFGVNRRRMTQITDHYLDHVNEKESETK
jgi:uncharacterized protein (DUF1499 family)